MKHYTLSFKQTVVEAYLYGKGQGARAIALQFGIERGLVRYWTARYRHHGSAGLVPRTDRRYDISFKRQVLQHRWREALSYAQTAALYAIGNQSTIARWERQYQAGTLDTLPLPGEPMPQPPVSAATSPSASSTEDQRTLDELRRENEYLRAEVAYLKKLQALIQDAPPAQQTKRG